MHAVHFCATAYSMLNLNFGFKQHLCQLVLSFLCICTSRDKCKRQSKALTQVPETRHHEYSSMAKKVTPGHIVGTPHLANALEPRCALLIVPNVERANISVVWIKRGMVSLDFSRVRLLDQSPAPCPALPCLV